MDRNSRNGIYNLFTRRSLSARRAWIEIYLSQFLNFAIWSLSARRAWIEITDTKIVAVKFHSRSPQGERG